MLQHHITCRRRSTGQLWPFSREAASCTSPAGRLLRCKWVRAGGFIVEIPDSTYARSTFPQTHRYSIIQILNTAGTTFERLNGRLAHAEHRQQLEASQMHRISVIALVALCLGLASASKPARPATVSYPLFGEFVCAYQRLRMHQKQAARLTLSIMRNTYCTCAKLVVNCYALPQRCRLLQRHATSHILLCRAHARTQLA